MPERKKRLRVIAGPNGSGKSTLYNLVSKTVFMGEYVNADVLAKQFAEKGVVNLQSAFQLNVEPGFFEKYMMAEGKSWVQKAHLDGADISIRFSDNNLLADPASTKGYDAAIAADFIRYALLNQEVSFTFETVLSHPSKLNFLRQAINQGYQVYLYFVSTVSPQINIERIAQRVVLGGHDVPTAKVLQRYKHSLELLPELIPIAHRSYVFDNSAPSSEIKLYVEIDNTHVITIEDAPIFPSWIVDYVFLEFRGKI